MYLPKGTPCPAANLSNGKRPFRYDSWKYKIRFSVFSVLGLMSEQMAVARATEPEICSIKSFYSKDITLSTLKMSRSCVILGSWIGLNDLFSSQSNGNLYSIWLHWRPRLPLILTPSLISYNFYETVFIPWCVLCMHGLAVAKVLAFKYIDFFEAEPNQASGPAIQRVFVSPYIYQPSQTLIPHYSCGEQRVRKNGRLNTCNSAGAGSRPERQSPPPQHTSWEGQHLPLTSQQ